jgi:hypothetical protein
MSNACWRAFCLMVVGGFLLRGLALACIVPPLEMWDEYQHVGYLQYLIENHRLPIYGESAVPAPVLTQAVRFPMGPSALRQLAGHGAVGYRPFWASFPARPTFAAGGDVRLYEALHPPLYYWLAAPLFRAAGGVTSFERSVAVLRLANLALVGIGLAVLLTWLGNACRDRREAMLIGLWPALQPLYLLNAVRVSNDALAVTLGVAAVVALLRLLSTQHVSPRGMALRGSAIGLLLGLGVLAKSTDFALLPFAGVCLIALAFRRSADGRALLAAAAAMAVTFALTTAGYYAFNLRHYQMLAPMQQTFVNRAHHAGWRDCLLWMRQHSWRIWPALWRRWIVVDGLWFGGWSFLHPWHPLVDLYAIGLATAAPGWLFAWLFRRERLSWRNRDSVFLDPLLVPLSLVLTAIVFCGLCVHALQALLAWGSDGTWPWYAAVAMPWMLMALAAGAIGWRRSRLGYGVGILVPIACVAAEWKGGGWQMVWTYAQLPPGRAALARLALLQPPWLGTTTLLACSAAAALLTGAALVWCTLELWAAYTRH